MVAPWYKAWHKTELTVNALSSKLKLQVPHDVFSTFRIDEGTLLLLDNLSDSTPSSVLDMGCGYGALGLPIAAEFPKATVEMVDRDLLAVQWAAENARTLSLPNAHVHGSLGFRDLSPGSYDWILCNVPARIGRPFIENFFENSLRRLNPGGEARVVVIRDLVLLLQEIGAAKSWAIEECGSGPRHSILRLPAAASAPADPSPILPPDLYLRDAVEVGGLTLERPFDLGGDDPQRLARGLPVLIDALPKKSPGRVLAFRCGYGSIPLMGLKRWPEARVTAVDRDLLATDFTRRNAARLSLAAKLTVLENSDLPDVLAGSRFDLIVGELSPSAGEAVAAAEWDAISKALAPGGQALVLTLDKLNREWMKPLIARTGLAIHPVISREGYTVLRLSS